MQPYNSHSRWSFNSKLVRLKGSERSCASSTWICFNSKLVRLKVPQVQVWCHSQESFNSKLVRLKEALLRENVVPTLVFQFQTGSIKRVTSPRNPAELHGFNSKLVRLKDSIQITDAIGVECFNSKLVRLKVYRKSESPKSTRVSIPNWFD